MQMTKSGFYRFCLAKELGYSEVEARMFAEYRTVLNSVERTLTSPAALNDAASSAKAVRAASKKVAYKIRRRNMPAAE